ITLFNSMMCGGQGLNVTFDDESYSSHTAFQDSCAFVAPVKVGRFRPLQALNVFDNMDPIGNWTISVTDNTPGNGGTILNAQIIINQDNGFLPFPTLNDITYKKTGTNGYEIEGLDACGTAFAHYTDEVIEPGCDTMFSQIIYRTWTVTDEQGNVSPPCIQEIYVFRNDLTTLILPPHY